MGTVPKGEAISLAVGTDWDLGGLGSPHRARQRLCVPAPLIPHCLPGASLPV